MNVNIRGGNNNCCVVGCRNCYSNTDKSVKFYRFPGKPYEKKLREQWIQNVRRQNNDGSLWQPTKWSRICSQHFFGNEKSNHPESPSYVPSIFPKEYKKRQNTDSIEEVTKQKRGRFERALKRKENKLELVVPSGSEESVNIACEEEAATTSTDFCSQVNFDIFNEDNYSFVFECTHIDSNDVVVQANVGQNRPSKFRSFCDKKVGPNPTTANDQKCGGFNGYQSINDDEQLIAITGVTSVRFQILLSFLIQSHGNEKLDVSGKLLIFLMKMKLGLSYSALAVLFGLHRTTVTNIFLSILSVLVEKTKHFIFWPSKQAIMQTMPQAFKLNYPNCRVIIDCSELRIQQPNSVDKRVYTYSHYKGTFTAKFLVGISPNGLVTFLSKCYGGRSSDAFITNDSGFLNLLETGDVVLADKGFPGIKLQNNIILVMPPFVHDGRLTSEEVEKTYNVASVRIHVERSIQRIKTHGILHNISNDLMPYLDSILRMCCVFTNLQAPIIRQPP